MQGVQVAYDDVVREFQRIFFGENNDGLILREQWIAEPELLEPPGAAIRPRASSPAACATKRKSRSTASFPQIRWSIDRGR